MRVWRALTEARVVLWWLPAATFVVTEDGRFTLRVNNLPGLDEEISGRIEASEAPDKLVMHWDGDNLHTLVTIVMQPTMQGCRMTIIQRGFLGPQGTMRRRVLQRTYADLLSNGLPQALDRLVAEEAAEAAEKTRPDPAKVELGRRNDGWVFQRTPRRSASAPGLSSHIGAAAGPRHQVRMPGFGAAALAAAANAEKPVGVVPVGDVERLSESHRQKSLVRRLAGFLRKKIIRSLSPGSSADRPVWAVGAALLLLLALSGLMVGKSTMIRPPGPPQVGGGGEVAPAESGLAGGPYAKNSLRPTRKAAPPSTTPMPAAPAPTRPSAVGAAPTGGLTAAYRTEKRRLSGYDATITITNGGPAPVDDWSVTLTLPLLDLNVHGVDGAVTSINGKEVTFTPVDATRRVSSGSSVRVTFQVDGAGQVPLTGSGGPTSCAVDGRACAGIPE